MGVLGDIVGWELLLVLIFVAPIVIIVLLVQRSSRRRREQTPLTAGWFPDPYRRYQHRYFDGTTWTDNVSNGGESLKDPR